MYFIAVEFFTEMLGPEDEDPALSKISHVTELEISERCTGKKTIPAEEEGKPDQVVTLIKLFQDQLGLNKPKKGKKGKGKGGKKKKKK